MSSSQPQILRPTPRRPFAPFDQNSAPQQPPSPQLTPADVPSPSRNHSFMNLTSSTLLGIYSPTGYQGDEAPTPWGTGAQTPRTSSLSGPSMPRPRTKSQAHLPPPNTASSVFAMGLRSILLFGMGMGYGVLVRHLHDDRQLAPFQVEGIIKPRNDWRYLAFWGVAGVLLGSLMPWVDTLFSDSAEEAVATSGKSVDDQEVGSESGIFGADWTPVVRSVGAFVGIAYAIVRLLDSPGSLSCSEAKEILLTSHSANYHGHLLSKPPSHSLSSIPSCGISSTAPNPVSSSRPL